MSDSEQSGKGKAKQAVPTRKVARKTILDSDSEGSDASVVEVKTNFSTGKQNYTDLAFSDPGHQELLLHPPKSRTRRHPPLVK